MSSVCCPKAGHRDADYSFAVKAQAVKCSDGDQECERGIETAGDAYGQSVATDCVKPFGQSGNLDVYDFLAAFVDRFRACGDKGVRIYVAE